MATIMMPEFKVRLFKTMARRMVTGDDGRQVPASERYSGGQRVLDLTPWVHDPFEVLMRTQLGGGTLIYQALLVAQQKIVELKQSLVKNASDQDAKSKAIAEQQVVVDTRRKVLDEVK